MIRKVDDMQNEQFIELLIKAQNGDKNAESEIYEKNVGLIWSVARKFINRGYDLDDIFQIGCIGMLKAIQKFDVSFDVKFSTYAVPMIMGEIRRFLRDDGIIKVSRNLKEIANRAKIAKEKFEKENHCEPKLSEIANMINATVEELVMALDANASTQSIYNTINDDDKNPVYVIDRLSSNENDENKIIDNLAICETINMLEKRDRQIIVLRYLKGKTQSEIASLLGVSQVQVSRLEKKILGTMKKLIV